MKQISPALTLTLILLLPACNGALQKSKPIHAQRPVQTKLEALATGGTAAAALDQSSASERAAALAAPSVAAELGIVTVGLGAPAEQGLWLKSNLVSAPRKGRAVLANGKGVNVDLLPHDGGALLSLAAYRALGLGLTDLPQVMVQSLP